MALLKRHPDVYEQMLTQIRAGAFSWVAAQSLGIAPETFSRWMSRGARQRRGIFPQFRQDVERAHAEARTIAEIQVYHDNPLAWLRFGLGRSKVGRDGWTDIKYEPEPFFPPRHLELQTPVQAHNSNVSGLEVLEQLGYVTVLLLPGREMLRIGTIDDETYEAVVG